MNRRALAIVHQDDAGPGVFADAIRARGWELEQWLIAEGGRPMADPLGDRPGYDAVLSFGGAMNTDQRGACPWIASEIELLAGLMARGVPVLGTCLGAQMLCEAAGGEVRRAAEPEIGWFDVEVVVADDPVIGPLAPAFCTFQWHSYECIPPAGATELARSPVCNQAFRLGEAAWGIQFHAEVSAADAERWTVDWRADPDAVRIGIDPDRLRGETAERIEGWNTLGRGICDRFLGAVE